MSAAAVSGQRHLTADLADPNDHAAFTDAYSMIDTYIGVERNIDRRHAPEGIIVRESFLIFFSYLLKSRRHKIVKPL